MRRFCASAGDFRRGRAPSGRGDLRVLRWIESGRNGGNPRGQKNDLCRWLARAGIGGRLLWRGLPLEVRRELALVAHRASGATLNDLLLLPAHLSFLSFEVPRRRTKARARGWTLHSRAGGSRPGRARAETEQQLVANTKDNSLKVDSYSLVH